MKAEHRINRIYLAGTKSDAVNAMLAATGYNFSLLFKWFRELLWLLAAVLSEWQPWVILSDFGSQFLL